MAVSDSLLGIVNIKSTNQPVRAIRYFADQKKVVAFADCLRVGTIMNATPREISDSLMCDHHDSHVKNRVCRTVIISVKTPKNATKEEIEKRVASVTQAFHDLFKELNVPGAAWVHGNTQTIHGHGIFPNSDGQRTLNISPSVLRNLQNFKWTQALESGRGRGKRKAIPVYTRAKNLAASELAKIIFDKKMNVGEVALNTLEQAGIISDVRRKKSGEPISLSFQNKKFRITTLKNFFTSQQPDKNDMIKSFDPVNGASEELLNELEKVGFPKEGMQKAFASMKDAAEYEIEKEELENAEPKQNLEPENK